MLVELVETTTADGLTLHGACTPSTSPSGARYPVDALLLLHGVGSNFYGSTVLAGLATRFAQEQLPALRANTRGHDFVSLSRSNFGPQRQGAAYETVGQCHYDINAWCDFLVSRGFQRVGVIGHSLGAIKAVFAAAHSAHPAVRLLMALSPPRLSYSEFRQGARKKLFENTMQRAQDWVDAGKPETLIRAKYPFPLLITAAGYLDKYGPAERYNILRFAHQLPCPALFTFGEQELMDGSAAFAGLPQALGNLPSAPRPLKTLTITGANHMYDGCVDLLADRLLQWLKQMNGNIG